MSRPHHRPRARDCPSPQAAAGELLGIALHAGADEEVRIAAVRALDGRDLPLPWHDLLRTSLAARVAARVSLDLDAIHREAAQQKVPVAWLAGLTDRALDLTPERVAELAEALDPSGPRPSPARAEPDPTGEEILVGIRDSVLDLPTLLSMEIPERRCWVPWLPEGGIVMIYGTRGIGKTLFNQSLACSLSTGSPFLSWPVIEPCGVLYVDGEMTLHQLRKRFVDLLPREPSAPLRLLSAEAVYNKTQRDLRLTDHRMREAVSAVLADAPEIKVVILDNVSCLFTGLDEDKKRDWEVVVPWLLSLRHRGVAVVLVHHAGKGGDQRGTSGREDLLDTVIRLEKPHDWKAEDGARFVLRFTKSRGTTGKDVGDVEAGLVNSPTEGLTWTWKTPDEGTQARMLRLIAEGVDRQSELPEELGVSRGTVSKTKRKLIAAGLLREVEGGKLVLTDTGSRASNG